MKNNELCIEKIKEHIKVYGDILKYTSDILQANYMLTVDSNTALKILIASKISALSSLENKLNQVNYILSKYHSEIEYKMNNGIKWTIPEKVLGQDCTVNTIYNLLSYLENQEAVESDNLAIYKWIESNQEEYKEMLKIYA